MISDLRSAYDHISKDYLRKKEYEWQDFSRFKEIVGWNDIGTIIDVGGANGRNLQSITATLMVTFDLSLSLLHGYVGPVNGQRVAGALPFLPFRRSSASHIISIAVLHHFENPDLVIDSLRAMHRIGSSSKYIFSVWRRWRYNYREKLFEAIRDGKDIDPLINHHRPWYNSEREIMTKRFYHYYSFKELYYQLVQTGFEIKKVKYLGGRHDDANIFVAVSSQS